jgi:hypothetical protein
MFGFDPRNSWLGAHRDREGRGGSSWLDMWTEATDWWVDPTVAGAKDLAAANERALAELVDGIVGRFEGQRVRFALGGRPVRAELDWIRLRRIGERYEARLELTDVEADGWSLSSLSVAAASIKIEVVPSPRLTVSGIEFAGRSSLRSFVPWLDAHVNEWSLSLDEDGRITACRAPGRRVLVIEPVVRDGRLDAELRAARWRGMRLTLPMWLRVVRSVSLPALPHRICVLDARRQGGDVAFRATSPSLSEELELDRLRNAIAGRAGSVFE